MDLALECPTHLLGKVQPLADFDWILAHLVLQDEEYASYYSESRRYKVLDNSVNELLSPVLLADLSKAAEIVKPDKIVAPDFLGDSHETINYLRESIGLFGKEKILPVVQGDTLSEVFACADEIRKMGFRSVAVPYDLTTSRLASLEVLAANRQTVVGSLESYFKSIHLLGLNCLEEIDSYLRSTRVVSIDTGSPVLHGLHNLRYGQDRLLPKNRPTMGQMNDFGSDDNSESGQVPNLETMYYNIAFLRKVLNGRRN